MTNLATTLNELIEITRDGQVFYSDAVNRVDNPHLKIVFRGMIDAKSQLINALSEHVRTHGEQPSTDGTFAGSFRKSYAETKARLSDRKDATFVAQLEQSEDRLLQAFDHAAKDSNDSALQEIVARYLPKVRLCHEQMLNLKILLAA
jgi:uncharacterized protein (TIGR02284 family)